MASTGDDFRQWRDSFLSEDPVYEYKDEPEEDGWERNLDAIPIAVIEKYLRKKKLQQLNDSKTE